MATSDDLQENLGSLFGDVDASRAKELEVILAEMETRLRATIIRVLRPALEQITELDQRQRDLRGKVDEQGRLIGSVDEVNDKIAENNSMTKVLQDTLYKNMDEDQERDRATSDKLSEISLNIARIDAQVQEQKNDLQRLHREDLRIWEETARMTNQAKSEKKLSEDAIRGCHKRIAEVQQEIDTKIRDINLKREELLFDLYSEGKGLNLVTANLHDLQVSVQPIPELHLKCINLDVDIKEVGRLQAEFQEEFDRNTAIFQRYVSSQENVHGQMLDDFKKQNNAIVAHNAALMKDIRNDYVTEIEAIKEMRGDISTTLTSSDKTCQELEERMDAESRRIDNLARELAQDIDDLAAKRKKDRVNFEVDHHQLRMDLGAEKENLHSTRNSIESLTKLVGLIIEGSRVGCALQIQDYADRSQERWLTSPSDKPTAPAQPYKASELEKQRQKKEDIGFHDSQELVTELRKGLARGGYHPGQVPFGGRNFDRRDLLILHNRLLHKAQQGFAQGQHEHSDEAKTEKAQNHGRVNSATHPKSGSFAAKGVAVSQLQHVDVEVAMQPSANGGISAEPISAKGYPAGRAKDVESESPKPPLPASQSPSAPQGVRQRPGSQGQSGSRQRPGSQGQPQAVGSRGTLTGTLGETEPPPDYEPPVKLPPISSGRGAEGPPKAAGSPVVTSRPGTRDRSFRTGAKTAR
mmetsp:Transcript_20188/g.35928  ORF Transcript_20188/g.35928 Transcript_20188/m.35928 type:complete len:694 (-) Transcript_20188:116-2197(-)